MPRLRQRTEKEKEDDAEEEKADGETEEGSSSRESLPLAAPAAPAAQAVPAASAAPAAPAASTKEKCEQENEIGCDSSTTASQIWTSGGNRKFNNEI